MPWLTYQIVRGVSAQDIKAFPHGFFSCSLLLVYTVPWGYNKQNCRMPHEQFMCEALGLLQPRNKRENHCLRQKLLRSPKSPQDTLDVTQPKQNDERRKNKFFFGPILSQKSPCHNYVGKCGFLGWTLNASTTLQCHQQTESFLTGNIKTLQRVYLASFLCIQPLRVWLVHSVISLSWKLFCWSAQLH